MPATQKIDRNFFLSRIRINPDTGCWIWTGVCLKGYKGYKNNYGTYSRRLAHRLSYTFFVGPIPKKSVIRHLCANKDCVNPDHLEAGTQRDNNLDACYGAKRRYSMATLDLHQSANFTKLLYMGDSKSGKTGSLASLVASGYRLRILDFDNGLDALAQVVRRDCPNMIGNVEFRTLRDKWKATPLGPTVDGTATAFIDGLRMLDNWKYDNVDLGPPANWGPEAILVIDSLTFMSDAAFHFREPLVPRSRDGKYDVRAVYKDSQDAIENVLALLTSEKFRTNVIVISHIRYVDNPDGTKKGYPTAVGSALSPQIPRYFNSVALAQTGPGGKRQIQTTATAMIDLANPASFKMLPILPIETGLATFFETLRS